MADKTYELDELMKMPISQVLGLMAQPRATFHGTAVVRRADGSIKYDDPQQVGAYGEQEEPND